MNSEVLRDLLYVISKEKDCIVYYRKGKSIIIKNKSAYDFLYDAYHSYGCNLVHYQLHARNVLNLSRRAPFYSPENYIFLSGIKSEEDQAYINFSEIKKISGSNTHVVIEFLDGETVTLNHDRRTYQRQQRLAYDLIKLSKEAEKACFV